MDFEFWDKCPKCGKPLVNESNLWKVRGIIGGAVVGGGILGAAILPLAGFGAGGVGKEFLKFNGEIPLFFHSFE